MCSFTMFSSVTAGVARARRVGPAAGECILVVGCRLGAALCEPAAVLPVGGALNKGSVGSWAQRRERRAAILIQTAPSTSTRPSNGRKLGAVAGPRVRRPGARRECSEKNAQTRTLTFFEMEQVPLILALAAFLRPRSGKESLLGPAWTAAHDWPSFAASRSTAVTSGLSLNASSWLGNGRPRSN